MPESRPYWLQEAYLSVGSRGVRKGPGRTLECHGGRRTAGQWVVGPWQYQSEARTGGEGYWVGTTPPTLPPLYTRPAVPVLPRTTVIPSTCTLTGVLSVTKEILGVDNARVTGRYRSVTARPL